ncbi:hypothetical protein PENTCL1PPCAC_17197 [Pristionchus entomophagus]|uniref:G protein-coupled receptor n=1 Tax=Pristionchus entomophagus TaxID=358040 RepID=A0AAV5TL14_9BILA|nr:hypothetical protein PENTCL1PPCAC_17197 [Pristionchus entomophagus]
MQFASMAAFYSISWLSFRILPPLVGDSPQVWLFGITTLFVLLNSWSNAFVYLINNAEIKKTLRKTIKKGTQTSWTRGIGGRQASSTQ